ncbi:MAG: sugar transporter [Bacteroidetes bacterium]|uniref:Sugar transporter n=1 Tax=Candidatus Cryptobacteroides faecipullorum TaxID=2840764 RepID=A0A9D9I821_9BACT|nr:sugar transporter [Candidatus Cryptobacteroides faecipullorum]
MGYEKSGLKAWLPVIGLTFSAFIFNTSEFIPIGLLSDIAADFSITESHAGLMITVYAWVVALASLPLMLVFAKTESKKLMLSITALFVVSHVLSGLASDFYMLMLSRMGVACAHAIFWSIVTPLAVKTAPEGKQSTALSFIVSGSSIAMIVGLPLGRTIGLYAGWRATFLIIGAVALIILCILAAVLKKTPGESNFSIRKLPALFKTPALLGIYLITVIAITGHFTGYSYIEPFMGQVAGMGSTLITLVLTLFGVVGIFGSVIFSKFYDRHPGFFIKYAVSGICISLLLLQAASFSIWSEFLLCVFWGLAINSYNLVFQSEIIRNAPQGTAVAMSIYSGIYNVGIGTGALVGGAVCDGTGIQYIGYVGGAIVLIALVYGAKKLFPVLAGK